MELGRGKRLWRLLFMLLVILLLPPFSQGIVRYHTWKINFESSSPELVSINGQYPGPTMRGRVGDIMVVDVENQMPTDVVIRWNGIDHIGAPWIPSMSECAIYSGQSFTYEFVVDRAGTYFYHANHGLPCSAGLNGSLIVDPVGEEPFKYDGEFSIVWNDWWNVSTYVYYYPFIWVAELESLLKEGGERYYSYSTCSGGVSYNAIYVQCKTLHILPVKTGKTYCLRISNVASLTAVNFLVQGHKMTVVEADGIYLQLQPFQPFQVDNLDVYSGESYSVLITANQAPSMNYSAAVNVRYYLNKPLQRHLHISAGVGHRLGRVLYERLLYALGFAFGVSICIMLCTK